MATDRVRHDLWTLEIPLPRAFGTPAGPFNRVYAVVVRLRGGDGPEGFAHAQLSSAGSMNKVAGIMSSLLDERGGEFDQLIQIERLDSGVSGEQSGRTAVCAISMAAWDLLGHRRGLPCAELWGESGHRTALDAYASAFFSDASLDELVEEAHAARQRGFRKAKMRLGLPGTQDEARFEALCEVFPDPRSIAVEAHFGYTPERTRTFMQGRSREPMWIEDPMPYNVIAEASCKELVAAGEVCVTLSELLTLRAVGIKRLILDVQYLGGPLRFLESARTLQAMGCEIGSHTFASESLHLLAALPTSMPVEVFDWWHPIHVGEPEPDADGRLAVTGPGLGRRLNEESLTLYGRQVV
jgi:L-alanine-DL-glutamate epimerase-like enolase superfamily enzyme